jgi:hypothetical protein
MLACRYTSAVPDQTPSEQELPFPKRAALTMVILACVMGAIAAWLTRGAMNPDGISYLDLSDQWLKHPFRGVVNGYWSPLYPLVLALFRFIIRPSAEYEFQVVHLANFAIYLAALAAFAFFVRELLRRRPLSASTRSWWILWLFALFLWASITQITLAVVTPDLLLSAFVWLMAALALRSSEGRLGAACALGVVCGLAYLTKSVMFVIGIGFILAGLPRRGAVRAFLVAGSAYAIVIAPWIVALSIDKGRPTFGDTGKLAYALFIDDYQYYTHWHGEPEGSGVPVHPTAVLFEHPRLFGFGEPFHVTYAPWFDPSYWNEGMRPHFSLRGHVRAAFETGKTYYVHLAKTQWAFCGLLILILLTSGERRRENATVALRCGGPAIFGLLVYGVLHVEGRYVGALLVLLFAAMLLLVEVDSRVRRATAAVVTVSLIAYCAAELVKEAGAGAGIPAQWPVAAALAKEGLRQGDAVASVGTTISHSWPRLARVRVVAETPDDCVFWTADANTQRAVLERARSAGARAMVSSTPPCVTPGEGWRLLPNTNVWYRSLTD